MCPSGILKQQSTAAPPGAGMSHFCTRHAALLLSALPLTGLNYLHKGRHILTVESDNCNLFSFGKAMTTLSEITLIFSQR